jgi:hypothetical protein
VRDEIGINQSFLSGLGGCRVRCGGVGLQRQAGYRIDYGMTIAKWR